MHLESNPLLRPKKRRCEKSYAFFEYLLAKVGFVGLGGTRQLRDSYGSTPNIIIEMNPSLHDFLKKRLTFEDDSEHDKT